MHFNIRRYLYGMSKRKLWLLLIFVLPIAYILVSSIRYDRFTIQQNISISKEAPVALASSPTGFRKMEQIAAHPEHFLLHNFAVRKLYTYIYAGTAVYRADRQFRELIDTVRNDVSMTMPAENTVLISYKGESEALGETLVSFYSERLIQKVEEGLARSKPSTSIPYLIGGMEVERQRALWRSGRFLPLVLFVFFSVVAVLLLLGVLEWSDPSFKSERQVARYLGVPILGSIPDLNKISAALGSRA
jgi:hypothetical protein